MAYEPKPGSLSLFKHDRKEKESHPDYRGDGLDLQGNPVWVSAWIKEGAKGKFMSLSLQPKEAKRDQAADFRGSGSGPVAGRGSRDEGPGAAFRSAFDDDGVPFVSSDSII